MRVGHIDRGRQTFARYARRSPPPTQRNASCWKSACKTDPCHDQASHARSAVHTGDARPEDDNRHPYTSEHPYRPLRASDGVGEMGKTLPRRPGSFLKIWRAWNHRGGVQFAFEFIDSLRKLFDRRCLFGDHLLQSFDLPVVGVHAAHCRDWRPWRNTTYGESVPLAPRS
jgi:hypothetical protein